MGQWDLKLEQYRISPLAYRELKYFCLQYAEKVRARNEARNTVRAPLPGGIHGSGPGTPAENAAERAVALSRDIDLIEATAREAAPELYEAIMQNVTQGVRYEYLAVPCGRRQFYEARRKFFYLLASKRRML